MSEATATFGRTRATVWRRAGYWLTDAALLAGRGVRQMLRSPGTLFATTGLPVIFFVFFAYVLGSGMSSPGQPYVQFLFPGLLVATVTFSTIPAVITGLHDDLNNGIIDRIRSTPASVSAVLLGRALADNLRNVLGSSVLLGLALLAGVRFSGGFPEALAAMALLLLYGFAVIAFAGYLTTAMRNVEAAQMIGTAVAGPLGFVSSLYADPARMPVWLRVFAEQNPASHTGDALRAWMGGTSAGSSLWYAVAWLVGATLLFGWLANRRVALASTPGQR
ncbi:ABC transporter permease [Micromonospora sonneratiae]|uniref:Transport permease protein n=1 Tax=Micromonospora sonneratiae TaxID=1184706 RepID=A0ABW3YBM0_9ACTN